MENYVRLYTEVVKIVLLINSSLSRFDKIQNTTNKSICYFIN